MEEVEMVEHGVGGEDKGGVGEAGEKVQNMPEVLEVTVQMEEQVKVNE